MSGEEAKFETPTNTGSKRFCILLIVEPGLDGVFRHVEGLVGYLFTQNVQINLAYSSRRSGAAMIQLVERVRAAGGEVADLKVSNYPSFGDIPAFFRIIGMIRRLKPDVVHAHSSKAGALGRIAAMLLRHKRYFYSPQAYYGMAKPLTIKVRFYNWVERLLSGFGTTIAISNDEATFAQSVLKVPKERIRIIHNSVNARYFLPATPERKKIARELYGVPEDAIAVAIVGRMCWQKDPETAYAGIAPVCAENADLLCLHLGWGTWKPYLLDCAKELGLGPQLKILDYKDDPRTFFDAIDVLLVSSRYEAGWPLVFLEAMACNLPLVAATGIGMSDVGKAGLSHIWTFTPEDINGCTEALHAWLKVRREGIKECNHRDFAINRLSPERCFGAVFSLYLDQPSVGSISPFP